MVKWLELKGNKESGSCYSCGKYKMKTKLYNWYHHPALTFLGNDLIGTICNLCAKREAGAKFLTSIENKN